MGYKFWCEGCGHMLYEVGSNTWYTSGTVIRYPKYGYGGCCVPGKSLKTFSYSGNVVKLECAGCTNKFGIVTWYDWKNRSGESTGWCNGCRARYQNEERRREARERAKRERKAEAARLEARQRRERETAIEQARIAREAKIQQQKEAAKRKKREQEINDLMGKLRNDTGSNPSTGDPDPTPPENKNVYDDWMKLDTAGIVKDIGDRVARCSAAGQDLVDNVDKIEESLKDSLKDHYSTIEPEVERYKEYGNEMKNMNNVFTEEFTKVFKEDCVKNIVDVWNTCDQKEMDDAKQKEDFKGINMDDPSTAMKQFQGLLDKHKKQKNEFDANMDGMMSNLDQAINNVTSKLDIMEKYYDDMINDNNRFIKFCMEQGDHYGDEMREIKQHLEKIGAQIRPRRDLYEGNEEEKKDFTVEYEVYVPVNEPSANDHDKGPKSKGFAVIDQNIDAGIIIGGLGGFICGGPVGMVAGGILGGLLVRQISMLEKDKESGIELVKKTEQITLTGKDYYDGTKQKESLHQIINALQDKVKDYKTRLENAQSEAEDNNTKAEDFKSSIINMRQQVDTFKNQVNEFKQKLSKANRNEKFRETMETKCTDLFNKIWGIVNQIKDKNEE